MRLSPVGWELSLLFIVVGVLAVGLVGGSTALVAAAAWTCAVAAPVAAMSFVVRLVAGILDGARRRRAPRGLA